MEVVLLERAGVLLPEVLVVARAVAQLAALHLLHVQLDRGEHIVVGVQLVHDSTQTVRDIGVLESALLQKVELANGTTAKELLHEMGLGLEVVHDGDDHTDDLLVGVGVQRLSDLGDEVGILIAEEHATFVEEREHPEVEEEEVNELSGVGDAEVEDLAQTRRETRKMKCETLNVKHEIWIVKRECNDRGWK